MRQKPDKKLVPPGDEHSLEARAARVITETDLLREVLRRVCLIDPDLVRQVLRETHPGGG